MFPYQIHIPHRVKVSTHSVRWICVLLSQSLTIAFSEPKTPELETLSHSTKQHLKVGEKAPMSVGNPLNLSV